MRVQWDLDIERFDFSLTFFCTRSPLGLLPVLGPLGSGTDATHLQSPALFRLVSSCTGCYQLPKFRCTNVHPRRYASPIFRHAIFRWCHESQWTTLVFEWFRYLYVRVLNPHCSKCVWRSLYVEGLSVHYLYKYFNFSYLSFWCDVKRYSWDPNTGQVRYSNVLPIPYSNGVILNGSD